MKGVHRSSALRDHPGYAEAQAAWDGKEAVARYAGLNLSVLRSRFPNLVLATNDEPYVPGRSSRHFEGVSHEGAVISGGIPDELMSDFEHLEMAASLAACWDLEKGPDAQSILILVGRRTHPDLERLFVDTVWPVSYNFLFARNPVKLVDIKEAVETSQAVEDAIEKLLHLVDLVYCPREGEFALMGRHGDVEEVLPEAPAAP